MLVAFSRKHRDPCPSCGDGFVYTGVEECDDGNTNNNDGCSNMCALPSTYGPDHMFAGLSSSFFITQVACANSGGNAAGDADYFCKHFYAPACVAISYSTISTQQNPKMHSGTNCYNPDPNGVSVAVTIGVGEGEGGAAQLATSDAAAKGRSTSPKKTTT